MQLSRAFLRLPLVLAISAMLALTACSGDGGSSQTPVPAAPTTPSMVDSAPVDTTVPAYVDNAPTNQRGDARYATMATNAGVRLLSGFEAIWKPLTELVDAGVSAPANGSFPAVVASTWTGLPNDGTPGGTVMNSAVHNANIQYAITATTSRTPAQETAAYLDDRRGKGYSVTDGMGPLTPYWRAAAQQTTSITAIASDSSTVLYNDTGNNIGVVSVTNGVVTNASFGRVVDLISAMGLYASTEPAKRFYKYARPFRWSSSVVVAPSLVPAISATPSTDGGFPSGHTAEAMRDAVVMAYVVPERFQEMLSRGLELGENRILAGMHSPLDVIGGRIQGQAFDAGVLADPANAALKAAAVTQAHAALMAQTGTTPATFNGFAHSATTSTDRFANYSTNKANYLRRMTFGFPQIAATNVPAVVPKGAEVLLETRLPYLTPAQRRVVLKTTALASGYPVMDDAEGWGRLNLFAAADGYGVFTGDVTVTMDGSQGGFSAQDSWRNNISGTGMLTKLGSGILKLTGRNSWTGGTLLSAGTLEGDSASAFGTGDVYVGGGTLVSNAPGGLTIAGKYTQVPNSILELDLWNKQGQLAVTGVMTIAGGTLHVTFPNGYTPAAGDTVTVISAAGGLSGRFTTIVVDGFTATPVYSATGLQLLLGT